MRPAALCLLAVIGLSVCVAAGASGPAIAAPLLAWANQQYFSTADQPSRASYQVHDDFQKALQEIVTSAVQPSSEAFKPEWLNRETVEQHAPEVVLVVLGSQLKTSDLRSKAAQSLLSPLQSLLDKAQSSLSVPYIMHEAAVLDNEQQKLQKLQDLVPAGVGKPLVVGCDADSQQSVAAVLEQQLGSEPAVIITCTKVEHASAGTPEAMAAELQQLQEAHDAVAALKKRQMTVYAVRPDAGAIVQQRRRLQAVNADVGVCGELCQTQVKWLEGILAAFILAIAAFSGMCCLYMLDTPTRFEKPKEGARND